MAAGKRHVWDYPRVVSDEELLCDVRILMVGAGGIGSELVKCVLPLSPESVTIMDLDTIDVSNLNRQFLFRKEDVGKPKAEVAAAAARRMNPKVKVDFIHDKIQSYGFKYVMENFDVVLSALDNVEARRYLNRICLVADVPIVEAGSAGYHGQSRVMVPHVTECYDCVPKSAPKTYPVCTIRSRPTTPVHCVHWARMLLSALFSETLNSDNVLTDIRSFDQEKRGETTGRLLATKLFTTDIEDARALATKANKDDYARFTPLKLIEYSQGQYVEQGAKFGDNLASSVDIDKLSRQKEWQIPQVIELFVRSYDQLRSRNDPSSETGSGKDPVSGSYDKDDPDVVSFVTAAADLRCINYGVKRVSLFELEGIAGAIVPAVASTNAIVAGLQTMNLLAYLRYKRETEDVVANANEGEGAASSDRLRDLFVKYPSPGKDMKLISSSRASAPNPKCLTCGCPTYVLRCLPDTLLKDVAASCESIVSDNSVLITAKNGAVIIYDSDDTGEGDGNDEGNGEEIARHSDPSLKDFGIEEGECLTLTAGEKNIVLLATFCSPRELRSSGPVVEIPSKQHRSPRKRVKRS